MIEQKDDEEYTPEWWIAEIKAAEKELDREFRDSGDKIVKRYLDRRDGGDINSVMDVGAKKYNIFWSNTQILKSALYASPPQPTVRRLHADYQDAIARVASLIFQRILSFDIMVDNSDMHRAFQNAVEDRLVPGMGQIWMRLNTETQDVQHPPIVHPETGQQLAPPLTVTQITDQAVCTDYVHWRDFIWSPARIWSEVWWVARRVWMTKSNFVKRFGPELYNEVKDASSAGKNFQEHGYPKGFEKNRVQVLEVWCKESKCAYWLHEFCKIMLDQRNDPLQLRDFFPCPQPLIATHTTNSLCPRSDFAMVQDQYDELDLLNDRISILSRALRVVGAYDSRNTELASMITGKEFAMIPVDNWAMLGENGGVRGAVDWFPIEQVGAVLKALIDIRPQVIQQIYELTSISDIMRGGSDSRETLGAQKLKAQYNSVRLRLVQQDVALFVANAMKIKCEIISKHVQPEIIAKMASMQFTDSAPMLQQAIAFIKDWDASQYRIEITEESLSIADYTAERELRIAYLTAVGQFISQAATLVAGLPSSMPYLLRMIMWVTASFHGGDDIEQVLDEAAQAASAPQPPQPPQGKDPAMEAQAKAGAQIQIDNNELRNDILREKARGAVDIMTQPVLQGGPNAVF